MQYFLIIVWIGFLGFFAKSVKKQTVLVCGKEERRHTVLFALIAFLPIILMAANRSYFGDTEAYRGSFLELPDQFSDTLSGITPETKDPGFTVFSAFLKIFIGKNDLLYFLIIAVIQGICLALVYRKYSTNYLFSVFLFLATSDYLSWMFNGIRQFLAVTVLFACIGLILKKKYVALIVIIILVSRLHASALLMIPMIFIAQGKPWNRKTLFFIVMMLAAVLFVNQFTTLLSDSLQDTQYNDLLTNGIWETDDGTNFLRVAVYSVPAILSLIGYKKIREADDPVINLCVNMSIIAMGIYIVAMFTSGIYVGRLPIYFSLYSYILMPWLIKHIFGVKDRSIVWIMAIIFYLVFYYYQISATWNLV